MKNARLKKFIFIFQALLLAIGPSAQAAAPPCIPGLPCVVNATPNDPKISTDGPNVPPAPNASKSDSPACDADFMNQVYAKAFLEANRENLTNEVIIRKPDSVLEYTCFDQLAKLAGKVAGASFSQSDRWKNTTVSINGQIGLTPVPNVPLRVYMGSDGLTNAIKKLVLTSLEEYQRNNFANTFLGGTMDPVPPVCTADYACSYMNLVYQMAKCENIGVDFQATYSTPFPDFSNFIGNDPRLLPEACNGSTQVSQDLIDLSQNKNFSYVNFDKVSQTYLARLAPPQSASSGNPGNACADPIPTGLQVIKTIKSRDLLGNVSIQTSTYDDKFCVNPSCYYDDQNDKCTF